jgi:hypothetical protein
MLIHRRGLEGNDLVGSVGAVMIDKSAPACGMAVLWRGVSWATAEQAAKGSMEVLPVWKCCRQLLRLGVVVGCCTAVSEFVLLTGLGFACLVCLSKSGLIKLLLADFALLLAGHPRQLKYSRIPSARNCADEPSRLQF